VLSRKRAGFPAAHEGAPYRGAGNG
jgi:hypothetical protein